MVRRTGCADGYIQNGDLCYPTTPDDVGPTYADLQKEKLAGQQQCDTSRGNPCNAANGNKYQTESDYVGGEGVASIVRHYNSLLVTKDYGFGFGWTWLAVKKLEIYGTTLQVREADGRGEPFTKNSSGQWIPDTDSKLKLVQDASGFTLTRWDGSAERYNTSGKLISETDRNQRITSYSYNESGQLATVMGSFGHSLSIGYDENGRIGSITNPAGGMHAYNYDAKGNLNRGTNPDGSFRLYHYEDTAFPHHLTGITDERGIRFATYAYDTSGKAILTEHAVTTNTSPQERFSFTYNSDIQTTVTEPVGNRETMDFEVNLGVKNLTNKLNQSDGKSLTQTFNIQNNLTCRKDEEGWITTYTYNATNQRLSQTEGQSGDCGSPVSTSVTRTATYQYADPLLTLPTAIESPSVVAGQTKKTEIVYSNNLPTQITQRGYTPTNNPISRVISLQYDSYGRVTSIDGPRLDVADLTALEYYTCTTGGACGQLRRLTNGLGQITLYDVYDAHGRLLQMTDPNGIKTSYTYDARGRVLTATVTPPTGAIRVTYYSYDAAGQPTSVTTPDGVTLTYTYDAAHYLRSITDNVGNKVEYKYDLKGNRTQALTRDPDGTLVRQIDTAYDLRNRVAQINAAGSLTQQVHDAVGNLIQATDPNLHSATHTYDPLSRLLRSVDALSGNTQYSYDTNDKLTRVTTPNNADTRYVYDDLGNLLSETSPDRGTTTYAYNAAGEVTQHIDARGIVVNYSYDPLGRITFVDYPGTAEDVTYSYDTGTSCSFGLGRLCQMQDESGLTQHAYDPFGNLTQQTYTTLGVTYTTRYTYDAGDRVLTITYPSGRQVTYNRDTVGRIASVNALVSGQSATLARQRSYRADGLLKTQIFGNNLSEQRTYDLQGRLTSQSLGSVDNRNYTYDPTGNVTQKQGVAATTYTYDSLDRLTADTLGGAGVGYTYDGNGNRLTDSQGSLITSYAYVSATNRLTTVGASAQTLDASGNLVGRGGYVYTYNSAGRLRQVASGKKTLATYTYNAQGLRTHKPKQRILYHYDLAGNLISETNDAGLLIKDYVWANNTPLAQIEPPTRRLPETVRYLHTDHLNTPRFATSAIGSVIWRWEGSAFGAALANEDPDGDRNLTTINLRFPGQYYDSETGFHYNWNRYYDPGTGRYITSDPIGLAGGLNTYTYAENNPLRYIDPTGLLGYRPPGPDQRRGGIPGYGLPGIPGPFGPVCGPTDDQFVATWLVPDIFLNACETHDKCYDDCSKTKQQCDTEFRRNTKGPLGRLYDYAATETTQSQEQFDKAREKCPCQ